ncbi:E3 ubiquitin ligase BIG BROTHER-related-like [Curcuma longa]|uniref:E3 ubiquitin ligase BIG BROTHER-related-like n=1 Tax=Curcuma longa TaxID=136217 RepID=UPI003D9EEEB3
MQNAEESGAGGKHTTAVDSRSPNPPSIFSQPAGDAQLPSEAVPPPRTPFTSLSQVDADLALARALQEQERAYAMLSMNGVDGSDYESSDAGIYDYEEEEEEEEDGEGVGDEPNLVIEEGENIEGNEYGEDAFDANDPDLDPAEFENDEDFARALQDVEEREVASRLMALAGLSGWASDDHGDHGSNSQDAWQELDPDEYSYEELVALGEVVGTESRGLSSDTIAALPSRSYKAENMQDDNAEQCAICRLEYEDGDSLVVLSCKHKYHPECINKWLQLNKVCPVCNAEVSTPENK